MIVAQSGEITPIPKRKWYSIFSDARLPMSIFNFTNSIIGSGVIGMPYAFAQSGIVATLILCVLITFLADYTLLILIYSGNKVGVKTYQDLAHTVLGKWGYAIITILQFGYPFLSLISYNIIIGDTITKVCVDLFNASTSSILNNRYFIISMVTLFITLPLCLFRQISALGKTSFLACVLLIFVTVMMFVRFFSQRNFFPVDYSNIYSAQTNILGLSNTFSILAFAFMTHHNALFIYHALDNPTYSKWKKATHSSVIGSILFSILFGMIGYMSFGANSQGDLFQNYCLRDEFVNIARFSYAIIIMLSFPLEGVVSREVVKHFFLRFGHERIFRMGIAVLVVGASAGLSFINDCLGDVLDLNGSVTAIAMAYIMPPLIYIVILFKTEQVRKIKPYIVPSIVFIIGVFFLAIGIYTTVVAMVQGFQCSHGVDPPYCAGRYGYPLALNVTNISNSTTFSRRFAVTF